VNNPGLHFHLTFDPAEDVTLPFVKSPTTLKPKIAILQEQGVNGHMEMAFTFYFQDSNQLMDVLGAGSGWAKSILLHPNVKKEFENFFKERNEIFGKLPNKIDIGRFIGSLLNNESSTI
ncbi:9345_t:CDS:2, partial [Entrophospora sp. SA101]